MQAIISFKTFAGSQAAFTASFSFAASGVLRGGDPIKGDPEPVQARWGGVPRPEDAERREVLEVGLSRGTWGRYGAVTGPPSWVGSPPGPFHGLL